MGMSPAPGRPTIPRARARLTIAATLSMPHSCWVMPIDQTRIADARPRTSGRSAPCRRAWRPTSARDPRTTSRRGLPPARPSPSCARRRTPRRRHVRATSALSTPLRNATSPPVWTPEELIGHPRAEQRALDVRRHPVALEPGLPERVDHRDLGAALLACQVQVLHEHRLVVGDVGAEQHDEVGVEDVRVASVVAATPIACFSAPRRRGVADARGVVDVVRAQEARRLLGRVVDLVGDAARGQVEGQPLRVGPADRARRSDRAPRPSQSA